MMDNSLKIAKALDLIELGEYFVLTRPRQYGKTTTMFAVAQRLSQGEEYLPINLNFQGIDSKWHSSDEDFAKMFSMELLRYFSAKQPSIADFLRDRVSRVSHMGDLSSLITDLVVYSGKKLVLMIDEVDSSANYQPFLTFLGMLRTKYLDRDSPLHYTFHSVMLVGVHDIKSLKYKIRQPEETQYNSPWNIAVDFDAEMEFNPSEIKPMLVDYSLSEGVEMDFDLISELLYYHTSGYPFLVSRLCQLIAEQIMPQKPVKRWEKADVEAAVQIILNETNTNFESLFKNLENHSDLSDLVRAILLESETIPFNPDDPSIKKGFIYGIFRKNGSIKIHNPIYEQRIYNYLVSLQRREVKPSPTEFRYVVENKLNMEFILDRFQQYCHESFGEKEGAFLEREWRLIFLAFLRPIINGKGYDFKEAQISEERRLDVVVTYLRERYLVELKIWRGKDYHERGLKQLLGYMESLGLNEAYLVIFDSKKEHRLHRQWHEIEGKRIFGVWV
jgi:hypothetical protein